MTAPSIYRPLVVWGAAGHALVVADIVRLQGTHRIIGFLDDIEPNRRGTIFCDATILGGREQLEPLLNQGVGEILLGFGHCGMRLELTAFLISLGFALPVAIHPSAVVAKEVSLGGGTVIAAGAVVSPGTRIGRSAIINTSASVDHECVIGDAAHICPGAHLAGRVTIGQAAQVGIGSVVVDCIHVGARAVIGAGAVVVHDVPDEVVAYGVPARIRRSIGR